MIHALTIDVEDYHNLIARDWLGREGSPTRAVVDNTQRLLKTFADHSAKGTFFVLGEVAESYPELIREIAAAGHELGVHGYYHRQIFNLTRESFRREIADAKAIIEDISGVAVSGHRAPAFSIMPQTQWALEVLAEEGFIYDSSIFPIAGRRYGWPGFRSDIHELSLPKGGSIIEAPLSTVMLLGRRFPACGGGYIRHFPGAVSCWAMRRVQRDRPAIVYLHPYEIESPHALPKGDIAQNPPLARFHRLQQRNRSTTEAKIIRLLAGFQFTTLWDVIVRSLGRSSQSEAADRDNQRQRV
jgi:polysaccharide deacetylase family protein (PEP-CTERM system associated)